MQSLDACLKILRMILMAPKKSQSFIGVYQPQARGSHRRVLQPRWPWECWHPRPGSTAPSCSTRAAFWARPRVAGDSPAVQVTSLPERGAILVPEAPSENSSRLLAGGGLQQALCLSFPSEQQDVSPPGGPVAPDAETRPGKVAGNTTRRRLHAVRAPNRKARRGPRGFLPVA